MSYHQLKNKQKKLLLELRKVQKQLSKCPEFIKPTPQQLSKKVFGKKYSYNELIIDDIIVINRMLTYPEIFSSFY